MTFDDKVIQFISLAHENGVKMLLVGGGAVNFHGYQRHSADVDFWIDLSMENLERLRMLLSRMDYEFDYYPKEVVEGLQNISIKISPFIDIELITRFNPGKDFNQAYDASHVAKLNEDPTILYRVLSYDDLINSKIRSGRPKDLLDIQELERVRKTGEYE